MNTLLRQSLLDALIIKKGTYSYLIHPLCDGFPEISPSFLDEVTQEMIQHIKPYLPIDRIVTVEAMGIPLAALISDRLHIPFTIIRKRKYNLETEHNVRQETGYTTNTLFINGITAGQSIIIVDDILSTGGTLQAIITSLQKIPVSIKAGIVLIDKGEQKDSISRNTNVPLHALAKITIKNGKIVIL